jgi:hypothetical protein
MGQQSNKVQKRRRRLDYKKRQKLATKTTAVTAKPVVATKTTASPAKKPAAAKTPAAATESSAVPAKA